MKRHRRSLFAVGLLVVMALLASTAGPVYAQRGGGGSHGGGSAPGGGGSHGGGGSWHGGGGSWHGGGGYWRGGGWGWGWRGGWWGPGVYIGAGFANPYWWYPYYGYPYPYAYPSYAYGYPAYSPPVVEGSPQTYIQQEPPTQQYWYYCQSAQGYYPYVRECPEGWQQVAPQPPPAPR